MEPLFEAKATINNQLTLYNIYRLERKKYRAEVVASKNEDTGTDAPTELILVKESDGWKASESEHKDLGETLGIEIDAFNNGYGDLLGKIGVG